MLRNLSKQATLALVGYIILIVSVFLPYKVSDEPDNNKYYFSERVIYSIVMLIPILISIYTINCMVLGRKGGGVCGALSWMNALSVFGWALLVLFYSLTMFHKSKQTTLYAPITIRTDDLIHLNQGALNVVDHPDMP